MNKRAFNHSVKYIRSWLPFRYANEEVPGFVVAIWRSGELVFNEAYGYADVENKIKLTPDHIFRIASHSKTFTATALMQLQEKGKLRIDDYVADFLPWLKEHKDKRWQKVTVRQLMSHGAGVIRDGTAADYWQLERPFPNAAELKKEILENDLVIDNNTKLKYSNFGYSLLGLVVEKISGMPYNDYVSKHIVERLGLAATGPEPIGSIEDKLAIAYTRQDKGKNRLPIDHVDTRAMSAATGFYATAADLCAYFASHFVGSGKLLDDESKKEMQRTQFRAHTPGHENSTDYGLGLDIDYINKRRTFGHGGGFPGHITKSSADPQDKLVVVALTNCIDGPATEIVRGIYSIIDYFQENTSDTEPKHDVSRLEGRYINLWSMSDIVVTGDKVVAAYPDSWYPLHTPESLEYVNSTTLKVTDANSFTSDEELVRFKLKDGKVSSVNYNGYTMWPEKVWYKKLAQKNRISLDGNTAVDK